MVAIDVSSMSKYMSSIVTATVIYCDIFLDYLAKMHWGFHDVESRDADFISLWWIIIDQTIFYGIWGLYEIPF